MNGVEAWSNRCRTDSSEVLSGLDLLLDQISIRLSYPDTEQPLNHANLESAILRRSDDRARPGLPGTRLAAAPPEPVQAHRSDRSDDQDCTGRTRNCLGTIPIGF